MDDRFVRTALVFGDEGMSRLRGARVAVFGVGGVGGHCVQALARAGIGAIDVFDDDVVSVTNINRQAVAMTSTIGRPKVEVIRDQILDINPDCAVTCRQMFYTPENADSVDLSVYDYIVDAIDTVKAKVELICRANALGVSIISAMGAGNKLNPTRFEVADLSKTSVCPLCRVMRTQLKKRGIAHHKVVYSKEEPVRVVADESGGRHAPGSVSFVPPVMGLILAGEVIKDLANGGDA
ncbi:MAG: tRNA threonylcarbamoyladenosine dehydratase [Clostridiales bacterium]|nr:tRNA threonylcarbamoyladenosine dehydratase [Clostridiales bacterium]